MFRIIERSIKNVVFFWLLCLKLSFLKFPASDEHQKLRWCNRWLSAYLSMFPKEPDTRALVSEAVFLIRSLAVFGSLVVSSLTCRFQTSNDAALVSVHRILYASLTCLVGNDP